MIKWSFSAELLALIMIIMVALYFYDGKYILTLRRKLFECSIWLSIFSIILNIICIYLLGDYFAVPSWVHMTLNSFYFLVSVSMSSVMALYIFDLLLEYVYDKRCRTKAYIGVGILSIGYFILVLCNLWNHKLFWFDEYGVYHRGAWNRIGYVIMLIQLSMVIVCYCKNRSSIGSNVVKMIHTLPPFLVLMVVLQHFFSDVLMNGTIVAFVQVLMFLNFQNMKIDQDSLTGIGNRKRFFEAVSLRLAGDQTIQVMVVSLKNFAILNQRYGYQKGDEFLYSIATWLSAFHKDCSVFRFGNISFVMICPYHTPQKAREHLEKLQERFEHVWELGEITYRIPACFVNMICGGEDWEATQFVECMVHMIDVAKKSDLGIVHFNDDILKALNRKKYLVLLLKKAIDEKRVQIWYQPVFDYETKMFSSAEALLRVPGEDGMIISPGELIPLAEEKGMIDEVSWIVIGEVCRFLHKHADLPIKSISINLSMQQFMNRNLYEQIDFYLKKYDIPVEKLKLEITERVILYDQKYMKTMMEEMTAKGIRFYLDDFGVGYSNFSSVMHLPFECVKLDRSLFTDLTENKNDVLVVKTMIDLFHNIGIKVVSEGIETQEQLDVIRELGTDYVQGYVFERPLCEKELLQFYKRL